jgi:uncharacterized protein YjbI with pentapeptide repeats
MKKLLLSFALSLTFFPVLAQEQISASLVVEAINKKQSVQYDGIIVTGDLDFTELANRRSKSNGWNSEEIKSTVEVPVVFRNCTFQGDVIGYKNSQEGKRKWGIGDDNITYSADFDRHVVFENCIFEKQAEFKYSHFRQDANFSGTHFKGSANFKYADFRQLAQFGGAKMNEYANFKYAEFRTRSDFANVIFRNNTDFKYAKFSDPVSFRGSRFQQHADFKYCNFSDGADFDNTDFDSGSDFKYSNGKRYLSR